MRIYHYLIATCLGSGFFPVAPGTVGSVVGVVIFWFLPVRPDLQLFLIVLFFLLGAWSAGKVEREKGEDPGLVNVDELVGQWITLLLIAHRWQLYLAGFFLFRLFDIWKPFPVRQMEKVRGGWGIMLDDVVAGVYGLLILQLIAQTGVLP